MTLEIKVGRNNGMMIRNPVMPEYVVELGPEEKKLIQQTQQDIKKIRLGDGVDLRKVKSLEDADQYLFDYMKAYPQDKSLKIEIQLQELQKEVKRYEQQWNAFSAFDNVAQYVRRGFDDKNSGNTEIKLQLFNYARKLFSTRAEGKDAKNVKTPVEELAWRRYLPGNKKLLSFSSTFAAMKSTFCEKQPSAEEAAAALYHFPKEAWKTLEEYNKTNDDFYDEIFELKNLLFDKGKALVPDIIAQEMLTSVKTAVQDKIKHHLSIKKQRDTGIARISLAKKKLIDGKEVANPRNIEQKIKGIRPAAKER